MNLSEFANICEASWNPYLQRMALKAEKGELTANRSDVRLAYPRLMLCTETPSHFVVELGGLRRTLQPLRVKKQKVRDVNLILGQPEKGKELIRLGGERQRIVGGWFQAAGLTDSVKERFPRFESLGGAKLVGADGSGIERCLDVGESISIRLSNMTLVQRSPSGAARIRHFGLAALFSKDLTGDDLRAYWDEMAEDPDVEGVMAFSTDQEEALTTAASFVSFFLSGYRETTVGDFLRAHGSLVRLALGAREVIHEVTLPWLDGPGHGRDEAIRPDLMVRRMDGTFDICDLKLAMTERVRLTRGERRRRRFISSVHEGLAQLANYAEYFESPQNASYAAEKYGITVRDPKCMLVVGNYENFHRDEIAEASRFLGRSFEVIDYDTLMNLYLAANGVLLPLDLSPVGQT